MIDDMDFPYRKIIIDFYPRLLSLVDRDKFSPLYGCFDKNFWLYKIITDFTSPMYQSGALALALHYTKEFDGNILYNQNEIKEYAIYAMKFWCQLQHKNGALDEWFPGEYSYNATAMTTADIADTYLLLRNKIDTVSKEKILSCLIKTGHWLVNHNDYLSSCSNAAAIYALYSIYLASENYSLAYIFKKHAEYMFDRLLMRQNKQEGWLPEYDGCDPCYMSSTIGYLAKYYIKANELEAVTPLKKAIEFISYFCHPDGSFGGEYGSRGGCVLDPVGLEICAKFSPHAHFVLKNYYNGINNKTALNPLHLDYKYALFFISRYIEAMLYHQPIQVSYQNDFTKFTKKYFPVADIGIRRNTNYYCITNLAKGGLFKLFHNNKFLFNDNGYYCILKNGTLGLTQFINPKNKLVLDGDFFSGETKELFVKTNFFKARYFSNQKRSFVLLRLFNYTLGKITFFASIMDYYLKNYIVNPLPEKLNIELERNIIFDWYEIKIVDKIFKKSRMKIKKIGQVDNSFHSLYSFHSNIFLPNELAYCILIFSEEDTELLNIKGEIKIIRTITFSKEKNEVPSITTKIE
ncbi:hypothetical protein HZA55_10820 [Candidatus Poribacteria bacterium]|nr:hypothetical protein [Candidatus Poribacteria bacterium]